MTAPPASSAVQQDSGFERAVLHGLNQAQRSVPFRHLFDLQGCTLFERVVESPAYYLTRAELQIMNDHAAAIAQRMGPKPELVEWNAGPLRLVRRLIEEMDQPLRYIAIDMSAPHLAVCTAGLQHDYPGLNIEAIAADFTELSELPAAYPDTRQRIGLLGRATLCTLSEHEALALLARLARLLPEGALLLSIDLVQDPAVQHQAYNDPHGAMALLHLHLLNRCNRELGAHFNLGTFRHEGTYDFHRRCMNLQLVSQRDQEVLVAGQVHHFSPGDPIRTLQARSYSLELTDDLARRAGWRLVSHWTDPLKRVALCWLKAYH